MRLFVFFVRGTFAWTAFAVYATAATVTAATATRFSRLFPPKRERDYADDDYRRKYDYNNIYRFHNFSFFLLYNTIPTVVTTTTAAQMNAVHHQLPIV